MKKFRTVSILGVGLIGGSIGLSIKKRNLAHKVIGLTTRRSSLSKAKKLKAIDEGTLSLKKATEDADLIIVCTPVGVISHIIRLITPFVKSGAIITDVGSTKGKIVKEIESSLPKDIHFVGGHPMAGSERRGVEVASCDLFEDSVCILTRTKRTHIESFKRIKSFWKSLGAKVKTLSPTNHDKIIARVSHLPHLVAVALVKQIRRRDILFVSSGFKDTTRISEAASDIWRDICLSNKEEIVRSIDNYIEILKELREKINTLDSKAIMAEFEEAKRIREKIKK